MEINIIALFYTHVRLRVLLNFKHNQTINMIELRLTVTDIPKEKIYKGEKGSYLTINVAKMQKPDNYGNDYTAYIYDKDTRQKIYIGKGKGKFEDAAPAQQGTQDIPPANTGNYNPDDLPF